MHKQLIRLAHPVPPSSLATPPSALPLAFRSELGAWMRVRTPHPSRIARHPVEVRVVDLKALFFVRDFTGDARYREKKTFPEGFRATM